MSHNTLIHRVARVLVRPLVFFPVVTPNHITTLRLLTGILASAGMAIGQESYRQVAAALFLISIVLDRADGELARLSKKGSLFGHKYDLLSDALVNALVFLGLGVGLRDDSSSIIASWAVMMGALAGLAVLVIWRVVSRVENVVGIRAAEIYITTAFDPDDAMLAVPVLIWFGLTDILLSLTVVFTPLFASFFLWKFRYYLTRSR